MLSKVVKQVREVFIVNGGDANKIQLCANFDRMQDSCDWVETPYHKFLVSDDNMYLITIRKNGEAPSIECLEHFESLDELLEHLVLDFNCDLESITVHIVE